MMDRPIRGTLLPLMRSRPTVSILFLSVALTILAPSPEKACAIDRPSTASAITKTPPVDATSRALTNLKAIVLRDAAGGFIAPKFAPDGLQLLLSRPGYLGIYIVAASGGLPRLAIPSHAAQADWTRDGLIGIRDPEQQHILVFHLDGTLDRTDPLPTGPVHSDHDRIYTRPSDGGAPIAVSDTSDRFIEPKLCPLGKNVAYTGVQTGLFLSRADGTGTPIFLGRGENVNWGPKGDFLLFARTRDDGHDFVEGDLLCYELQRQTLFNLTAKTDLLLKSPSLSPDGKTVALEAEGIIYTASLP